MCELTDEAYASALAKLALDDFYADEQHGLAPDSTGDAARAAIDAAGPLIVQQTLRSALMALQSIEPGSYWASEGYGIGVARCRRVVQSLLDSVQPSPYTAAPS